MGRCIEEGCEGDAIAEERCMKHYQRRRREQLRNGERPVRHKRGPERRYTELRDPYGGAPKLSVRLDPEVYEWVSELGGGAWVRRLLARLNELRAEPSFKRCWERISEVDK